MYCTLKHKILTLCVSGLLIAIVGLIIYLTFPIIMDKEIKKRLVLKEGSQTYKYWKDVPVPIYIKFYFFNLTNPEEFYDLQKPVLEELGPYTFREEREKVNITWNKNGTVSYKQLKRWYFQPDKTVGSLSDIITTLNVPMIAAATKVQEMNQPLVSYAIQTYFDTTYQGGWLVNKTVEEFLFKGYEDDLITFAQPFMDLPYDKFGWFYKRNNTDDGEFSVYTGENDIKSVDEVDLWNDQKSVSSYSPPCNMINGSAGDMWPPDLTEQDNPTIFVTDICRSLSFTYLKNVKTNGIRAYRYWADDTQLDNGKHNPDHLCFCSDNVCLPAGAVNVSTCKFDAPAVVSYPHFLFADSSYSQGVIGMHPDPQEHRMYIDLIPEMGVPLGVAARMQINILFQNLNFSQFSNITRRTFFPMFWFSETAEAGSDITDQLKLPLVTIPLIGNVIAFIMVAVGSFFVLTAFVLALLHALGKIHEKTSDDFVTEGNFKKTETEKEPAYDTVKSDNSN